MLDTVLDDRQREAWRDVRHLLGRLQDLLVRLGAELEGRETFDRVVAQLDELFLLVIVGEFNSGKSALINAMVGQALLDEGVTPTTDRVTLIRYGAGIRRLPRASGVEVVEAPVELLREINLVDTPGTNAVLREHEALTREFVPRSDLVLFVTSADRPFTESERSFLEIIAKWGKKIVLVVNKMDILERAEDADRVIAFVEDQAKALLGMAPAIFGVSARAAAGAKAGGDGERLQASGVPALEAFVAQTLDRRERVRLKLLSPIGVGARVLSDASTLVARRLEVLRDDFETLDRIEADLNLAGEDLRRDFRFRLTDVEQVIRDFERRGHEFFDETLRLGRIFDLMQRERIRDEFERKVVADLPRVVEKRVEEIVDWMVDRELKQWQAVMARLQERQTVHAERIVGRVDAAFAYDRQRLIEGVRREAQRAVEGYDHQAEAKRLASVVRDTIAGTALLQVSALGLGAAVAALATTTLADVTGLLAAGVMSVIGLLLLPARRREARVELQQKVTDLRERLMRALNEGFETEIAGSRQRLLEAMSPYTRFVRGEGDRLAALEGEAGALEDEIETLRARIEAL